MREPKAPGVETGKSEPISPRRRLLEEVLRERSKAVAGLPALEDDPPSSSWQWKAGITALLATNAREPRVRRRIALNVCVVALAWLEAIDAELEAKGPAARREE